MGYELSGERAKQKRKQPTPRLNSPPLKQKYTRKSLASHCEQDLEGATSVTQCIDSNSSSANNCPICHKLCKEAEELSTFNERSIGCDGCNAWFHFG